MRLMPFAALCAAALAIAFLIAQIVDLNGMVHWAAQAQRGFQNAMATSLRAIQSGDPTALLTLCGLTFGYGFVHAVGPGHGKFLLGAAAVASRATLWRMSWLTLASSLAQSLTAVLLVVGGIQLVSLSSSSLIDFTEDLLAPLSYVAMGLIGCLLALRGGRAGWRVLARQRAERGHCPDHGVHACSCGHSHGPSLEEASQAMGWREMTTLIASIAIRPCTGALFLLVIAWRFEILPAGILATFAMGLGTAAFNVIVAGSGVGARVAIAVFGKRSSALGELLSPVAQITAGFLVITVSVSMLMIYL